MPKLQWMKFYPADWLNDTMIISAEARGCWINLLCWMWNGNKRGVWEGTYQEFSRVTGTPWECALPLITELEKVCSVTRRDILVTLQCRRMVREEKRYKNHSNRQARYRRKANSDRLVTAKIPLDSSRLLKTTTTPLPAPEVRELVDQVFSCLTAKLGEKPVSFPAKMLGPFFKRALRTMTIQEIRARVENWFQSTDDFIVRNGYPMNLFVTKFSLLKGGPINAQENGAVRGSVSPQAPAGKYAALTENPGDADGN